MTTGVLLINLGTPDSHSVKDVRKYLREFLSDPYVIDTHPLLRWFLLNFIILPTRPKQSAKAYKSIWSKEGSPLLINSIKLTEHAQQLMGNHYKVVLGKRYGKPSIASAIHQLKECDKLIILPLFPQYSLAATQTAIDKALHFANKHWAKDKVKVIKDFYNAPEFINTQAQLIKESITESQVSDYKILFSYHGLPERQIQKTCACNQICDMQKQCPAIEKINRDCYRAQCYATTEALASALNLQPTQYSTSFQSRLGRIPWIKPYTDEVLPALYQQGVRNLVVACPSFVCDCLETLEEIGIRAAEQWIELGGNKLILVPCVNGDATWVPPLIQSAT